MKKNNTRGAKHGPSERQRMYCKVKAVLQKNSSTQAWRIEINTWKMARIRHIPKVFVTHPVDRGAIFWIRQDCFGRPFIRRNKTWKNSECKTLGVLRLNQDGAQQPPNPRPDFAQAKRECKRMQRWTCEKESTRILTTSSWSTIKTTKRTSVRRNRRAWLSSRSSNRLAVLQFRVTGALSHSPSSTNWDRNNWVAFFRTSFGCREIHFPTTDGGCEQNTRSYSMYRCAQCVSTSHCTVWPLFITRTRLAQDCKPWCAWNILSSTCHVSFFAAPDTDHQHKLSLTYLSNLTVILSFSPKPVDSRSMCALRRFTAELRFLGSPIAHRLWAQKDRARQESWGWTSRSNTRQNYGRWLSKSNHWRYGWIWKNWCQVVVLQPVTETLRLWFSRKHWWLGPRRRTITRDAGFTAENTGARRKLWFISKTQSFRETWCNVFIWPWTNSKHVLSKKPKQRTRRPVREWCSFWF